MRGAGSRWSHGLFRAWLSPVGGCGSLQQQQQQQQQRHSASQCPASSSPPPPPVISSSPVNGKSGSRSQSAQAAQAAMCHRITVVLSSPVPPSSAILPASSLPLPSAPNHQGAAAAAACMANQEPPPPGCRGSQLLDDIYKADNADIDADTITCSLVIRGEKSGENNLLRTPVKRLAQWFSTVALSNRQQLIERMRDTLTRTHRCNEPLQGSGVGLPAPP
ncbi:hypothetical protein F2P81_019453 [Scophthalmus maximus]|uniref:Uncharacterized protein n=1 Tax=Scophthalmus maximus TaxID=52904 RepID=A0A6A4RZM6_SCOMX|nr:hypothetical protein F2P81_019453 [Scophthalmus maximus]